MAVRWGAGEELFKPCNMELFSTTSLDEQAEILQASLSSTYLDDKGLDSADSLEALQSCLDPTILSIFEDTSAGEHKTELDEENETTLLTALTEILDNVDDENLSPFDSLPDSELFMGQKVGEHASLKKLLALPRTATEKESMCHMKHAPCSPGKTLPRMPNMSLQESDEEEDGFAEVMSDFDPLSLEGIDWGSVPLSLEHSGECVSLTLSDLVRQIHPYCMTVSMEGEEGSEQMLPEGGIVLEVVDKGENGEPILAIPDLGFPLSLPGADSSCEQMVPETNPEELVQEAHQPFSSPVIDDRVEKVIDKQPKRQTTKKCEPRKKKKWKKKEVPPGEGRVLRSASAKKAVDELPKEPEEETRKKKKKVTFANVVSSVGTEIPDSKCVPVKKSEGPEKDTSLSTLPECVVVKKCKDFGKETSLSTSSDETNTKPSLKSPESQPLPITVSEPLPTTETSTSQVNESRSLAVKSSSEKTTDLNMPSKEELVSKETIPPPSELKPKSLSLQQYRLLRQQKKPAPLQKAEDNSAKWPQLPEAPRELPPIPCLPDPSPRDPRRASHPPVKEAPVDVMPAWQPRGPSAPPTPEALLVPPATMVVTTKKTTSLKQVVSSSSTCSSAEEQPVPSPVVPQNSVNGDIPSQPQAARQMHTIGSGSLPDATVTDAAQNTSAEQHLPQTSVADPVVRGNLPFDQDITNQVQPEITPRTTAGVQPLTAATPLSESVEPVEAVTTTVPEEVKCTQPTLTKRLTGFTPSKVAPIVAQPFLSAQCQLARPVDRVEPINMAPAVTPPNLKNTEELIQSFTSEIGIEASDLTSLLEQFEENQAKKEPSKPEVCGRAAAVGNSCAEPLAEHKALELARIHDLGSTAGLSPPATPPHQMWKPLAPVALLGKTKMSEGPRVTPSKAIQIEARPLPSSRLRNRLQTPAKQIQPFSLDHDYCLPPKELPPKELGNRWNVKQQPSINIKTIELPKQTPPQSLTPAACHPKIPKGYKIDGGLEKEEFSSSVLETPDASPNRLESEKSESSSHGQPRSPRYSERSPSPYERERGRARKRYRPRKTSSDSSCSESGSESSYGSRSPTRKRYRSHHSGSSSSSSLSRSRSRSCSRSRSHSPPRRRRFSYSSSRSGSWSRSRSRSPQNHHSQRWKNHCSPDRRTSHHFSRDHNEDVRRRKEKAIEERRVVYIGRIRGGMTRKELKERFSLFGEIEECTLHFREHGDNYGFVTYYETKDAFSAIENGWKLRQPNELPFDLCFGGRRQFCKTGYADLDSNRDCDPAPAKSKFDALDFDTLLKQAQKSLKR